MNIVEQAKQAGITQVQTFAGWQDIENWTPYGHRPEEAKSVEFYLDLENQRIRERARKESIIPMDNFFVTGCWPIR